MALERCEDCGKMHYRTNPCAQIIAKKSGNSRAAEPAVVPRAKSTGRNNKAVAKAVVPAARLNRPDSAGSVKQAVDTIPKPKMGRPRIHPDRRAYLTMKQREYREKKRAAK